MGGGGSEWERLLAPDFCSGTWMKVRSTVFWGERTERKDNLAKIRQGGGGQVRNSEAAKEAFMI